MAIGHAGSWKIGGYALPDFGLTERIGGALNRPSTPQGGSNLIGPQPQAAGPVLGTSNYQAPVYGPQAPGASFLNDNVIRLNQNTGGGGGGGGDSRLTELGKMSRNPSQEDEYRRLLESQQNNMNAQIDADYDQAMSMLGSAEQGLRGQAGTAEGQITNEAAATRTSLGAEQATKEQGVQQNLSTAERQGTSAMQQARDLFRQQQQTNNAQMSALGISSSSVSEALAERLGVETARRIAGVTGSLDEVRQNATQELGRIKNYYSERATQIQDWVANEKAKIQNVLIQGLNQINNSRGQAASAKSQARAGLLQQVQQQIFEITQQQQQFDNSLRQWAAQKQAALTPIAQDPNYINKLMATAQTFNQQFAPTGFNFVPEVSMNARGEMTGQIRSQKNTQEDEFESLLNQI